MPAYTSAMVCERGKTVTSTLSNVDLLASLKSQVASLGLTIKEKGGDALSAEIESIKAKWFLGGRKVSYKVSFRLANAEHKLHFREMVTESSWGIPPPTLSIETTSTKGWERSGSRKDLSIGGGGSIDYAQLREKVKEIVVTAGWQFHLEGGKVP